MMIWLAAWLCLISLVPAFGQTYFGVLTTPANTGPGGSCCATVAMMDASGQPVPTDGSCVGCSVITKAQYDAYTSAAALPSTTTSAAVKAATGGMTLTCSSTQSLSGTYAVDEKMMTLLNTQIGYFVVNNNSFVAAAQVATVRDVNGNLHTFPNINAFKAFYSAVGWYWMQLVDWQQRTIAGQTVAKPPATSTAC